MVNDNPAIREVENKGYIGSQPFIIGNCAYCKWEVTDNYEAYETNEGELICGDTDCIVEHAMGSLKQIN